MARLKITAEGDHFKTGAVARLEFDGVDISRHVSRVELIVDANEAITATVHLFVSELEIDLPAVLRAVKDAPGPRLAAIGASLPATV